MLYSITHRTTLEYSSPITESVMEVRAQPRADERQVLRQFEIDVTPTAQAGFHSDWLGNIVHQFSVLQPHQRLLITSRGVVETRPLKYDLSELAEPLEGLIRDHRSWDFLQDHGPVTDDPALPLLAERLGLGRARCVGEAIELVLKRTRDVISYRRGVTDSGSTVRDVLRLKSGVCQDFAHLGLALLRRAGVPCRYVSGYLYKQGDDNLETHAWIEAFVPGLGWLGVDPTHGVPVSEHYVTLAVGRSYADVPPNRGVYRGDAKETIAVAVQMTELEERARLSPFSTVSRRATSAPPNRVQSTSPAVAYGLEQQVFRPSAVGFVVQQQRQQQQ